MSTPQRARKRRTSDRCNFNRAVDDTHSLRLAGIDLFGPLEDTNLGFVDTSLLPTQVTSAPVCRTIARMDTEFSAKFVGSRMYVLYRT